MHRRGQQPVMSFGPPLTPPVIQHLIIANVVVFILQALLPGLVEFGSVRPYLMWHEGHIWEPITYMWLHGSLIHLLMND